MAKGTVLIVDDDVNARIIAETLLETRGWRVYSAGDGAEACEMFGRLGPTVVVTELTLPGMNGLELIRHLRGRFQPLPMVGQPHIVVVSNESDPATQAFALRLGANAFLTKPVVPAQFVKQVEELIATPLVTSGASASLTA